MATPPQGAGNSDDLRMPVNATQGARDFLVDDDYQFDFSDFLGPRPSGSTISDAAQQDSRNGFTPAAFGSTLPDSPHLQSPGGTPVTVGQDADRLITELDRDRDRAVKLELFRAMCAAFDQAAAGYAAGPGHILAQEFKQYYLRFWTAALKGESPTPLPRGAAHKPAAKAATYASVASQPEGPTTYYTVSPESQVVLLELLGKDVPGAGGIPSGCLIESCAHGAEQSQLDGAVAIEVVDEPVGVLADGHR
ncbi:hypothetical protein E4U13_007907, partial [Claviceps humidiphila]